MPMREWLIRAQHEMTHFVGDDVAERDREIRGGAGHRRDALAEDGRPPAGLVRLAEHTILETLR